MAANLGIAVRHVRTVALLHPTLIRGAPIGRYYFYEDRRVRLRVSDQVGLDDIGVWVPTRGDPWTTMLLWFPLLGRIRAATDISPRRLDPVSASFGGMQEPGVVGLARRALDSCAPRGVVGGVKMAERLLDGQCCSTSRQLSNGPETSDPAGATSFKAHTGAVVP